MANANAIVDEAIAAGLDGNDRVTIHVKMPCGPSF